MDTNALTREDRALLHHRLVDGSQIWRGGLDMLEARYRLRGRSTPETIELACTLAEPPYLHWELTYTRATELVSYTYATLPQAPELDPDQLAAVERILQQEGELWLSPPSGSFQVLSLSDGLAALERCRGHGRGQEPAVRHTRFVDRLALIYLLDDARRDVELCVWVDLERERIAGVEWPNFPVPICGRWYPAEEIAQIERTLREEGDFGVYGDVRDGLRALMRHAKVSISSSENRWHVGVHPPNHHGHTLHVDIDRTTGAITCCSAGHALPLDIDEVEPLIEDPEELV